MMDDTTLQKLAEEFGTPCFVFDADGLAERVKSIKKILNTYLTNDSIRLCYSIKANPFLIPAMIESGVDKLEVCSPGELSICQSYKVPGEMIIYSGVHKEIEDITDAIEYGAGLLTAESVRHYELIREAAGRFGRRVGIILRLSSKSQFGMSPEDIEHILIENKGHDMVEIRGLHYFVGTQRLKLKHQREELSELRAFVKELREKHGYELPLLEYGPGLGHPYFEKDDFSDTLMPLKELSGELKEAAEWSKLTVEMGRFLVSGSGCYLTRVADKKRSYGRNWCILDGGINHVNYLGQMMGMMVPIIKHFPAEGSVLTGEKEEWALCGSLCTTNDVLVRSYSMREPEINDLLAFYNIGAYSVTEAMGLFLSRDLPKIIIYKNGKADCVRGAVGTWKLNCRENAADARGMTVMKQDAET